MDLGELGIQYVIKSQKAFQALKFSGYETVDRTVYYMKRKKRDEKHFQCFCAHLHCEITCNRPTQLISRSLFCCISGQVSKTGNRKPYQLTGLSKHLI